MAEDYITAQQEDDYEQNNLCFLLREAAIHIINGMSEYSAINHVKQIAYLRSEAEQSGNVIKDGDGFIECYLESELSPPSDEGMNKAQIYAIHKKLCESEGVDFK